MDATGESPLSGLIVQALRGPLLRMLLLSLSLHAAVIMIVQPRPYPAAPDVVVLSARLADAVAEPAQVPLPEPAEPVQPVVEPAPAAEEKPAPPQPVAAASPEPVVPTATVPLPRAEPADAPDLPSVAVMVDSTWYEARQLDAQPRAMARIEPAYPEAARRQGIEGTVKLRLRIDEFGVVREVEVEEGEPPGVFDASALEAFSQGRFVPARKDGRPVRALIYIRVRYELGLQGLPAP